ncbi:MAG: hypothetical protein M0Q91_15160 [Methanoregula sp.]|jgi:hypothetical protein|nr:hypothetical protein [Methanoregula sp.]
MIEKTVLSWREKRSTGKIHAFVEDNTERAICGEKNIGACTYPVQLEDVTNPFVCKKCLERGKW